MGLALHWVVLSADPAVKTRNNRDPDEPLCSIASHR